MKTKTQRSLGRSAPIGRRFVKTLALTLMCFWFVGKVGAQEPTVLIDENIQSWTQHTEFGDYTQSINVLQPSHQDIIKLDSCKVLPDFTGYGANTPCSNGAIWMMMTYGVIEFPRLTSVSTAEFIIHATAQGKKVCLQYKSGDEWVNIGDSIALAMGGNTCRIPVDTPSSVILRLASPTGLIYVSDIKIYAHANPDCQGVEDIAAFDPTATTAKLTWTEVGTASAWQYIYSKTAISDFEAVPDADIHTAIDDTVELTNLDPYTPYYIYVRAQCGSNFSNWTAAEPNPLFKTKNNEADIKGITFQYCLTDSTHKDTDAGTITAVLQRGSFDKRTEIKIQTLTLSPGAVALHGTDTVKAQQVYDFTNPVEFVVRAEDGTEKTWTITLNDQWMAPGSDCEHPFEATLPYYNEGLTTIGMYNDYNPGTAFLSGTTDREDMIVQFIVDEDCDIVVTAQPYGAAGAVMGLYSSCPREENAPWMKKMSMTADVPNVMSEGLTAGTYFLMFDGGPTNGYDFALRIEANTCARPTNLVANPSSDGTAAISWTTTASACQYTYATSPLDNPALQSLTTTTASSATLTGLSENTTYYVYVRAKCDDTHFSNWSSTSFNTACPLVDALPWTENFDGYAGVTTDLYSAPAGYPNVPMPECWTFVNRSESSSTYPQSFLTSNTTYAASGNCLLFKSSSTTPLYAVLPLFTTNIENLMLTFTYRNEGVSTSNGTLSVGVMTDPADATTFMEVQAYEQTTTKTEKTLYFSTSGQTGQKYIAFKYTNGTSNNMYLSIDNVTVDQIPTCPPISNLAVANITATTADLSFTEQGSATAWQYVVSEAALANPSTGTVVDITANTFTISDLTANTEYHVYVRAKCSDEDQSEWVETTFRTPCGAIAITPEEPYVENFDSYEGSIATSSDVPTGYPNVPMPDCWMYVNRGSSDPSVFLSSYSSYAYSQNCLFFRSYTTPIYAVLPLFNDDVTDNLANLELSFKYKNESTSSGKLSVGVMTNPADASTFSLVEQITSSTSIADKTISFAGQTGKKYIAFKYEHTTTVAWFLGIDNVKVRATGTGTDILTFNLPEQTGPATIDAENHIVTAEVSHSADLTAQVPTITVSPGATISPASGTSQDFTNPVTYTVTAEDNSTQEWTVTVTKAENASSEKDILTFTFTNQVGEAVINTTDATVSALAAWDANLESIAPTITVSSLATISPASGAQDFTNSADEPVIYTVTAEDASTKAWTVTIINDPDACPNPTAIDFSTGSTTTEGTIITWMSTHRAAEYFVAVDTRTLEELIAAGGVMSNAVFTDTVSVDVLRCEITGLQPNTHYNIYLQSKCSDEPGDEWLHAEFTTACGAIATLPYEENFDNCSGNISTSEYSVPTGYPDVAMPDCWTFVNRSESTSTYPIAFLTSSTTYAVSGNCLFFKSSLSTPLYAVLPLFTTDIENLMLTFTYRNEGTGTSNGKLSVGVMTDPANASTFTEVQAYEQTTTLTEKTLYFSTSGQTGQKYIAFKYTNGTSNNMYLSIDNVTVDQIPTCPPISNLAVANITATTAGLSFTEQGSATAWQYVVSTTALANPSANTEAIKEATANTFTISDLTANTEYHVYVRAKCSDDDQSEWVETTFRTAVCEAITITPEEPYVENFDNCTGSVSTDEYSVPTGYPDVAMPNCWTFVNRSVSSSSTPKLFLLTSTSYAYSENCLFFVSSSNDQKAIYAVLPLFNEDVTDNLANLKLSFKYKNESATNGKLSVGVMTNPANASTFTEVEPITSSTTITDKIVSFAGQTGTKYIAFRYENTTSSLGWFLSIDNVKVSAIGTGTDILTFTLPNQTGPAVIDTENHTVTAEVSHSADLTAQTPVITVSPGATISPASGSQDFTSPVTYTVTAEDNSTQEWTVTVTNAAVASSEKDIMEFTFANQVGEAVINTTDTTVSAVAAWNANLESIAPTITVSSLATISPASGSSQNFSNSAEEPVIYTVTAEDSTTKAWKVTIINDPDACPNPTMANIIGEPTITSTSVTCSWSKVHHEVGYFVAIDTAVLSGEAVMTDAQFRDTVELAADATSVEHTINGLEPNTLYYAYIQSKCGDDSGNEWLQLPPFKTECAPVEELPYTENFDSYAGGTGSFPDCWTAATRYNNYPYIENSTSYAHSGTNSLKFGGNNKPTAVTSQFAADIHNLQVTFQLQKEGASSGSFEVGIMSDPNDTTTFVHVQTINPAQEDVWIEYTVYFSNTTGTDKYIAFRQHSTSTGWYYWLDDVTVDVLPDCMAPAELIVSGVTHDHANVAFTERRNSISWQYTVSVTELSDEALNGLSESDITLITNQVASVGSLNENTTYYFYIRSVCGEDAYSDWASTTFTTLCAPIPVSVSQPFTETFEESSSSVECWRKDIYRDNNNANWRWNMDVANRIAKFSTMNATTILMSPCFNFDPNMNTPQLSFKRKQTGTNGTLRLYYKTTVDGEWTPIPESERTGVTTNYVKDSIFLPNTCPTYWIGFEAVGGASDFSISIDEVEISQSAACVGPDGNTVDVRNVTDHSATISWTQEVGGFDRWEFLCSTRAGRPAPGQRGSVIEETNITVDTLQPNTTYYVYVRTICSETDTSDWTNVVHFRTQCAPETELPWTENFDGYTGGTTSFPDCWTAATRYNNYPYIENSTYANSSPNSLKFGGNNKPTAVTPQFAADIHTLQVTFQLKREGSSSHNFEVGVMSDPNDVSTFELVQFIDPADNVYHEYTVMFGATSMSGTGKYIAFRQHSTSTGWYYWLDDVTVSEMPPCPPVSHLIATSLSASEVEVSFTEQGSATAWQYVVSATALTDPSMGTAVDVTDNPFTISDLAANTEYHVYVRANCSDDDQSPWAETTVRTECGPIAVDVDHPFVEGFETNSQTMPCWSVIDNNGDQNTWGSNTDSGNGCYSYPFNTSGPADDYLFTPGLQLGAGIYIITFKYKSGSYYSENLKVQYGTSATVGAMTNDICDLPNIQISSWTTKTDTITVAADNVYYIGFYCYSTTNQYYLYVDDVRVEVLSHTITTNAGVNGRIDPSGAVLVAHGTDATFNVIAEEGYKIASLTIDNSTEVPEAVGQLTYAYTFDSVIVDHTIAATFEARASHTITASVNDATMGRIEPAGEVQVYDGSDTTFVIRANAGYRLDTLKVDGNAVTAQLVDNQYQYRFTDVTEDHSIRAIFGNAPQYHISTSVEGNGTVNPTEADVFEGGEQSFTITPMQNWHIESVVVDPSGANQNVTDQLVDGEYKFTNVRADHLLKVVFVEDATPQYHIDVTCGAHGRIEPAGPRVTVDAGTDVTFTITAEEGYKIKSVTVDGQAVAAAVGQTSYRYEFPSVDRNHELAAEFELSQPTLLDEAAVTEAMLYPNPVADVLNIEVSEAVRYIEVVSLSGQLIDRVDVNASTHSYDVSNLQNAGYLLYIYTFDDKVIVRKFVVER